MILTCPDCGTQYVVKDGAIPPEGRQVRCAACKHSWHQDPEVAPEEENAAAEPVPAEANVAEEPVLAPENAVETSLDEPESIAEATLIEPRSGPEAEERAYEAAAAAVEPSVAAEPLAGAEAAPLPEDLREPPQAEPAEDNFSPFAYDDEVEPRRGGPLKTILILAVLVVAAAALFWFFAPAKLKGQLGLDTGALSPLALVTTHMDRQQLESGNELLTVTGRVINPTAKEQDVPPLQAQLRSKAGKVVYSWTIAPPTRSLPAGASASFNSAEVNVPPGGDELTITLGQPHA